MAAPPARRLTVADRDRYDDDERHKYEPVAQARGRQPQHVSSSDSAQPGAQLGLTGLGDNRL